MVHTKYLVLHQNSNIELDAARFPEFLKVELATLVGAYRPGTAACASVTRYASSAQHWVVQVARYIVKSDVCNIHLAYR